MADLVIRIRIDTKDLNRGLSKVEKGLGRVEKKGADAGRALRRAFAFVGLAAGIRTLLRYGDTFISVTNRIKAVQAATDDATVSTEDLFKVARRTRASIADTAKTYSRLALAGAEMGLSARGALQATETLNKAIAIFGATNTEASAGLQQLAQGIGAGKLAGDELRSAYENIPVVVQAIADELGVARAEVRNLAAEGKITGAVVIRAIGGIAEQTERDFAKLAPTIAQGFTVIKNSAIELAGQGSEAFEALARGLIATGDNLGDVAKVAGVAAAALTVFAAAAAGAAAKQFLLNSALLANPYVLVAAAIAATAAALALYSEDIVVATAKTESGLEAHVTLADVGTATWKKLTEVAQGYIDVLNEVPEATEGAAPGRSIADVLRDAAKIGADEFDTLFNKIEAGFKIDATIASALFSSADDRQITRVLADIDQIRTDAEADSFFGDIAEDAAAAAGGRAGREFISNFADTVADGLRSTDFGKALDANIDDRAIRDFLGFEQAPDVLKDPADKDKKKKRKSSVSFADVEAELLQESRLLKILNPEREIEADSLAAIDKITRSLTESQEGRIRALVRENRALEVRADLLDQVVGAEQAFIESTEQIQGLVQGGDITAGQGAFLFDQLTEGLPDFDAYLQKLQDERELLGETTIERAKRLAVEEAIQKIQDVDLGGDGGREAIEREVELTAVRKETLALLAVTPSALDDLTRAQDLLTDSLAAGGDEALIAQEKLRSLGDAVLEANEVQGVLNTRLAEAKFTTAGYVSEVNALRAQVRETTGGTQDLSEAQLENALRTAELADAYTELGIRVETVEQPMSLLERQTRQLSLVLADGGISVEEFRQKLLELRATAFEAGDGIVEGFQAGLIRVGQQLTDIGGQAQQFVQGVNSSFEQLFVDGLAGEEEAFVRFINSIQAEAARLSFRILTAPLVRSIENAVTDSAVDAALSVGDAAAGAVEGTGAATATASIQAMSGAATLSVTPISAMAAAAEVASLALGSLAATTAVASGAETAGAVVDAAGVVVGIGAALANGGQVRSGQLALVGERGPELFMSGRSGRVMSNAASQAALGGGQQAPIHVHITNIDDGAAIKRRMDAGELDGSVINMMGRKSGSVSRVLQR